MKTEKHCQCGESATHLLVLTFPERYFCRWARWELCFSCADGIRAVSAPTASSRLQLVKLEPAP